MILDAIKLVSEYAISNREEFIRKVQKASETQQQKNTKGLERRLHSQEKRVRELDVLIRNLYESFALERISEKRFEMLLSEYEQKQTELETSVSREWDWLNTHYADTDRAEQFLALAQEYTDFSELTTPMINEFVDKILIHALVRNVGERTQEVEIYLKLIGKVGIPAEPVPKPTQEELVKREKRRAELPRRREYDRARYAQKKAQRNALRESEIA